MTIASTTIWIAVAALGAETTNVDLFFVLSSARISGDGKTLVLRSGPFPELATDINSGPDVYVRDLTNGALELISVAQNGKSNGGWVSSIGVSYDGRFVVFDSSASDLVPGDTNAKADVFVRDRLLATTERVSVSSAGIQPNDFCGEACISADGRYVAFRTMATNLVPGDIANTWDVFVHDRVTKTLERVNVNASGVYTPGNAYLPALSADGRYVAFVSNQGLVHPKLPYNESWVKDRQTGIVVRASVNAAGEPANDGCVDIALSRDGRYVIFSTRASNLAQGDQNGEFDVFLRDLQLGSTELISVTPQGVPSNGVSFNVEGEAPISDDGRFVCFGSTGTDIVFGNSPQRGALVRDRVTGSTFRSAFDLEGGAPNFQTEMSEITGDGRSILFVSYASDLVTTSLIGGVHAFLRDRLGFQDLHGGIAGHLGKVPGLSGTGTLTFGGSGTLSLSNAKPNQPLIWLLATAFTQQPFFGGQIAVVPPFQLLGGFSDGSGAATLPWQIGSASQVPVLAPEGYVQVAVIDPAAVKGVALSNVLLLGFDG